MLIVFIGVLLLVVAIIFHIVYKQDIFCNDICYFLAIVGYLIATIWLAFSMIFVILNFSTIDVCYENKLEEKQMLEYRLENEDDISGNELLYTQVVEFNNELRATKKFSESLWTNWFNNHKIATIEYIEIEKEMVGDDSVK